MCRKKSFSAIVIALPAFVFIFSTVSGQQLLKTTFFPEPPDSTPVEEEPLGGASAEGKLFVQDSLGKWILPERFSAGTPPGQSFSPGRAITVGNDVYLRDGSEVSLAVNYDDGNNLTGAYNSYWGGMPHGNSTDGNLAWTARAFPNGGGSFTGYPFDPWVNAGNNAGEFFSTLIRGGGIDSSHCILGRSTDNGASFSFFFEETNTDPSHPFQDKEAVDIDRTEARGGGAGTAHDGKLYLCYDLYSGGFASFGGTFLQVISSSGTALPEIPIAGFFPQPAAGIADGTVYIAGGSHPFSWTNTAKFHEITNGGDGPNVLNKSGFSYIRAGQPLAGGNRPGLNGHRLDGVGYLDIDRSFGPRRGYLYFISNRNPNPFNTALDQGDVYLSVSTNGASSWSSALTPMAAGKTQYFPMLDVDEQGWIHIAYYQNDTGSVNGGVLNAGTANLYYTVSLDGGTSWTPPVQVNEAANALDYEDPPPSRGPGFYLIGDYQSIKATGTGPSTKAYVLWSGYDKDRSGCCVGDAKARVWCSTVQSLPECQNDTVPPQISCSDIFVDFVTQCSVVVDFDLSVTVDDNCALPSALVCNPPSGSTFPAGSNPVVCTATDASGNADSCRFTVGVYALNGDLNGDGELTPADVVLELNCVFLGTGNCGFCFADGNCSGDLTPADVVLELNLVFLGMPLPC